MPSPVLSVVFFISWLWRLLTGSPLAMREGRMNEYINIKMDEMGTIYEIDCHSETLEQQIKLQKVVENFDEFLKKYGWIKE